MALHNQLGRVARAAHELAELLPTGEAGAESLDLSRFLTLLADRARELVGANVASIGVGSDPTRPFDPWICLGGFDDDAASIGPPRPVGTLAEVACRGKTLRLRDVSQHREFLGLPRGHPPLSSLLAIPISFRGQNLGNLYLANKISGGEFTKNDQRALELLVELAGIGLGHSMLLSLLDRERATLRNVLNAAPDGIVFVEAETGKLLASKSFDELFGERLEGVGADERLGILTWPDGRTLTYDELPSTQALLGKSTRDVELVVVRRDGTKTPISERAAPVQDAQGKILGAVCAFRDLSAVKQMERLREEFAAMVAHEQRSPIQSILMQIERLREAAETGKPPSMAALDRLNRGALRLLQMVSDLLESTRVELARVRLNMTSLDPVECVQSLVDSIAPTLGDHRVEISIDDCPPRVMLDRTRFEQILTNLLENAAKYSPGGTTVRVSIAGLEGGLEIAVRDEGMGIAPDEIPRLFDRFYQTKRARERRTGLGLGLYITKGLVDAHGGRIIVESAANHGTTVRVWFPLELPATEDAIS